MLAILEHVARRPAGAAAGPRIGWWLLVALAHGVLVVWLQGAVSVPARQASSAPAPVTRLRLLVQPPPPLPTAPRPPAVTAPKPPNAPPLAPRPAPSRRPAAVGRQAAEPAAPAAVRPEPQPQASVRPSDEPGLPAARPASPGAAPHAATAPLLDTEATQRAVRQIASERSTAARARAERGEEDLPSPSDRLGQAVQRTALGDCLSGEYVGAGMGLLSIPALALAQLRGRCAKGATPAQPKPAATPEPPGRAPSVRQ